MVVYYLPSYDHKVRDQDKECSRVGCPRGVEIIVPLEIKEYYSISPEDRKSLTVIEDMCAKGSNDIPPFIIVEGKYHMKAWYKNGLKRGEKVIVSESGFMEIALQ